MAKFSFVRSAAGVATSTTDQVIELTPTGNPRLICYDRITVVDKTSAVTSVIIGFKSGAREFILGGSASPGAGIPVAIQGKIYVSGDYRPFARLVGCVAGDSIELYAFGYDSDLLE